MKTKSNKKKNITLPKIKFSFNKKGNRIERSTVVINGILFTCILLSAASGFIDLTFFSGLSKSWFHIGTIPIAAAILYTVISIGFISGKFWCAMQIGMLRELQIRLEAQGKEWASNLKKARFSWHIAHKFLIGVSIITALSLSVNSIGAGIRTMEQNINNMTYDAEQLNDLQKSIRDGNTDIKNAKKDNINSAINAQQSVVNSFEEKWKYVAEYRSKRDILQSEKETADDDRKKEIDAEVLKIKREYANKAPEGVNFSNIDWIEEYTIKNKLLENAKKFEVIDSSSYIEEGITYDQNQIEDTIKALADKEYRTPDGELIKFTNEDGSLINGELAKARLLEGIKKWLNDTGDVGESSKFFTLVATYINADTKAGGMGISEWMMMIFIALSGIVQEYLIALFTPKATIDRKVLSQVSHYMKWKNEEEKERFLISVYISYVGDGIMNKEQFDNKCSKAVYFMRLTEDDVINSFVNDVDKKLPIEKKIKEGYSSKVDEAIKEIENLI